MHRLGVHVHVVGRMFLIAFFSSRHSLFSMRKQPTERTAKGYACAATPILSQRSSLDHFANPSLVSPRNDDETSGTWWRQCGLFSQAIISERLEQAGQSKLACVSSLLLANFPTRLIGSLKRLIFAI